MTTPRPTPKAAWLSALLACMVSGLVSALHVIVDWSLPVILPACAVFIGGHGAAAGRAFHDHKASGPWAP